MPIGADPVASNQVAHVQPTQNCISTECSKRDAIITVAIVTILAVGAWYCTYFGIGGGLAPALCASAALIILSSFLAVLKYKASLSPIENDSKRKLLRPESPVVKIETQPISPETNQPTDQPVANVEPSAPINSDPVATTPEPNSSNTTTTFIVETKQSSNGSPSDSSTSPLTTEDSNAPKSDSPTTPSPIVSPNAKPLGGSTPPGIALPPPAKKSNGSDTDSQGYVHVNGTPDSNTPEKTSPTHSSAKETTSPPTSNLPPPVKTNETTPKPQQSMPVEDPLKITQPNPQKPVQAEDLTKIAQPKPQFTAHVQDPINRPDTPQPQLPPKHPSPSIALQMDESSIPAPRPLQSSGITNEKVNEEKSVKQTTTDTLEDLYEKALDLPALNKALSKKYASSGVTNVSSLSNDLKIALLEHVLSHPNKSFSLDLLEQIHQSMNLSMSRTFFQAVKVNPEALEFLVKNNKTLQVFQQNDSGQDLLKICVIEHKVGLFNAILGRTWEKTNMQSFIKSLNEVDNGQESTLDYIAIFYQSSQDVTERSTLLQMALSLISAGANKISNKSAAIFANEQLHLTLPGVREWPQVKAILDQSVAK